MDRLPSRAMKRRPKSKAGVPRQVNSRVGGSVGRLVGFTPGATIPASVPAPCAIDLFAGVGGMSLGFMQAGFNVVAAVDSDEANASTYRSNFPTVPFLCQRVESLRRRDLLPFLKDKQLAVIFGGPPCQGFSLIGKRRSDDPRNKLLAHFFRLVVELRPRYVVMENVGGLLAGNARQFLNEAMQQARASGYCFLDPFQTLDAHDFGVPQHRRRLFVLGYLRGQRPPAYPSPGGAAAPTVWDAISDLIEIPLDSAADTFRGRLGPPSPYTRQLRAGGTGAVVLSGCLGTAHSDTTIQRFSQTLPGSYEPISRYYRLSEQGAAMTIRAGTGPENGSFTAARPIHPRRPRCITVREAARLQGFPDAHYFHPTKWHGFRQVGNAVPPILAKAVAVQVRSAMLDKTSRGHQRKQG